jgi:Uma2 family endonuclease
MREVLEMSVPAHDLKLSIDEYLQLEKSSACKYEFVSGRVFAMGGASQAHDALVINLTLMLGPGVKAAGCRILSSDMKVKVESTNSFYYPDLTISCENFSAKGVFISSPCLVVEVLSPSTTDIDRREKLLSYKTIDSLNEYMIVYQDQRRVEIYKRASLDWDVYVFQEKDSFELSPRSNIRLNVSLDELYSGVVD